jgi:hypothetical protein
MGKAQLKIEDIRKMAEEKGCKLLSDKYTSRKSRDLEFLFKCGHKRFTSYESFKLSKTGLCRKCTGSEMYTIEEVRKIIEDKGCKLISPEYVGVIEPIEILFSCGHKDTKSLDVFMDTKPVCKMCAKNAFILFDDIKEKIEGNGYKLIGDCFNGGTKTKFGMVDELGYKYKLNINQFKSHIKNNTPLVKFHKDNPYTFENLNLYLKLTNYPLTLDPHEDKWKGNAYKMTFFDNDGYKYYTSFNLLQNNLKSGGIGNRFSPYNIYTLENIKKWLKDNNKPFDLIDGQRYVKNTQKLKFKCHYCPEGEIPCEIGWGEIMNGNGCGVCAGNQIGKFNNLKYKFSSIAQEWCYERNFPKLPEQVAPATHDKYYWVCPECNYEYKAAVSDRTSGGNSCPICKESKGEKRIRKYLSRNADNYSLTFVSQYKFDDCRNLKPLPFDFAIFINNELFAVCEYQGKQHTVPLERFGGEEGFKYIQFRDRIKKDYCQKNNIKLLEIKYTDFDNIESILSQELNLIIPIQESNEIPFLQQELSLY